ncbi:hypothetical protein OL548_20810 [Lysinibacillus sp. MHQ-1]|nr:hypothetical protein OL548_20810 [Lysinibacillus sp. MHQ-1]
MRDLQDLIQQEQSLQASVTKLTDQAIHCRWLAKEQRTLHKEINRMFEQMTALL